MCVRWNALPFLLVGLFFGCTLSAQTTLTASDVAQLRAHISTANAGSSDYVIELASGTYTLGGGTLDNANVSGDLDITKTTGTLTVRPVTGATVVIDGAGVDRVFDINNGTNAPVTITDITISGGAAADDGSAATEARGGGVLKSGSGALTLQNVTITSNAAIADGGSDGSAGGPAANGGDGTAGLSACGGGLYLASGTVQIQNCVLSSNSATGGRGGHGGPGGPEMTGVAGGGGDAAPGGSAHGGAIYVAGATVTVSAGTITANSASGGKGGDGGPGGAATMFAGSGGTASFGGPARGAAVYVQNGSLSISDSTLSQNTATGGDGGRGGDGGDGLNTADGITAQQGGNGGSAQGAALFGGGGTVTITGSTLSANVSSGGGGGLGGDGGDGADAGHGGAGGLGGNGVAGGVYTQNASVSIANSTLSGNTTVGGTGGAGGTGGNGFSTPANGGAGGNGGQSRGSGGYIRGSTLVLDSSTIAANTATDGAGGAGGAAGSGGAAGAPGASNPGVSAGVFEDGSGGSIDAESCIFADNTATTNPDAGGNLSATNCVIENGVTPVSGTGNLTGDPGLGALQNNGGTTETHAIGAGSNALDAGSNPSMLSFDQRGTGFPRSVGTGVDVGAYEFDPSALTPTPTVSSPGTALTVNAGTFAIQGVAMTDSLVRVYSDVDNNGVINGADTMVAQLQLSGGTSSFSITVTLTQDADNDFTVTADSASAGESSPADVPRITEDSTAPTGLTVNDPSAAVNFVGSSYDVQGSAEAGALIQIYSDLDDNGLINGADAVVAIAQLAGGVSVFSVSTPITSGIANNFVVTASDSVGNESLPVDVPTITETSGTSSNGGGGGSGGGGCTTKSSEHLAWLTLVALLVAISCVRLRTRVRE